MTVPLLGVYDFTVSAADGRDYALAGLRGNVSLIVNTASRCGFTPQYRELNLLHERHYDAGLRVLAFPCNQFGAQEPATDAQIQEFCATEFRIGFPVFARLEVNGPHAHALFRHLKQAQPGLLGTQAIKWNFTKFLVDRAGKVRARYAPATSPLALEGDIEELLAAAR